MSSSGWCTIESDPAVFSELLQRFGVKGAAVEDVLCADAEVLAMLPQPVLGLVLLFKWKPKKEERNVIPDAEVYFAKQTVADACATQALVNILLNNSGKGGVELGPELTAFHDFTKDLDPRMRGEMIGQSDLLRNAHNSFARPAVFSFEDKKRRATEKDDSYHFVGYTFKDGVVWELDGLQDGPVFIEPAEENAWLATAGAAIQTRMQELSAQDTSGQGQGISFSLLALTADRLPQLEQQIESLKAAGQSTVELEQDLTQLREDRERHRVENQRRRHNYMPALVELFRALQEKGALRGIIDAHKETAAQALAKKKNRTEGAAGSQ